MDAGAQPTFSFASFYSVCDARPRDGAAHIQGESSPLKPLGKFAQRKKIRLHAYWVIPDSIRLEMKMDNHRTEAIVLV